MRLIVTSKSRPQTEASELCDNQSICSKGATSNL